LCLTRCSAGKPLFNGTNSATILASLLHDTPESPSALNTDIPPSREEIPSRLMEGICFLDLSNTAHHTINFLDFTTGQITTLGTLDKPVGWGHSGLSVFC
jgi:hypothetical protein